MSKNNDTKDVLSKDEKLQMKLSDFIFANRKVLIVIVGVILVALIALGVVLYVNEKTTAKQFAQISSLQTAYGQLLSEDPTANGYQSKKDALVADLNALSSSGGRKYPAVRAEYTLGLIYWDDKDYQQALEAFLDVNSRMPSTYLGSLALFNAGAASEELGDDITALEYYQQVLDNYDSESAKNSKLNSNDAAPVAAKALFGIARLNEKSGNIDLAKASFQKLADEFPFSEYGKLAQNRLLLL